MKNKKSKGATSRKIENEGIKILFVGREALRRSPTAAKTWNRLHGYSARSAGISLICKQPLCVKDIRWAEYILVMEERHKTRLTEEFGRFLKEKKVHVLNILDEYKFMDPDLVKKFEVVVAGIVKS